MNEPQQEWDDMLSPLKNVPERNPDAVRRGRAQFLAEAAQLRAERATKPAWQQALDELVGWFIGVQRPLATGFAAILFFFVSSWALVSASQNSVAGDLLYSIKQGWQQTQLAIIFDDTLENDLRLEFLNEMVRESESLLTAGRLEDFRTTQANFITQVESILSQINQQTNPLVQQEQLAAILLLQADLIQQSLPQREWGLHPIGIENGQLVWLGQITDQTQSEWQLNGTKTFGLFDFTVIVDPTLQVGDWVELVANASDQAVIIRRWQAPDPLLPPQVTEVTTGIVTALTADSIQIGETFAKVDENTTFTGDVQVGSLAELTAVRSGTVNTAISIVALEPTSTPTSTATPTLTPPPTSTMTPTLASIPVDGDDGDDNTDESTSPETATPQTETVTPTPTHLFTETPTATSTATPVSTKTPTTTSIPTETPVAGNTPEPTPSSSTNTPAPTETRIPSTATPVPPTATNVPPTNTPEPTDTPEPEEITIEGIITDWGDDFIEIDGGITFDFVEETVINGELEEGREALVSGFELGSGQKIALFIEVYNEEPDIVDITGWVSEYTGDTIILEGGTVIFITDQTNINGNLQEGYEVYVEAIAENDGLFARYIEVFPEENIVIPITGIVEAIEGDEVVIDGIAVYLTEESIIDGELEEGATAIAIVFENSYEILSIQLFDAPSG